MASHPVLDKAKVLVLFAFCLVNPFAGWAYLAQTRQEQRLRPPSIADRVKPKRLAVLPIAGDGWTDGNGGDAGGDWAWASAFEIDFADFDELEIVPIVPSPAARDPERNVLALAQSVHADLVLDANALLDEEENVLRLYVRLIRMADTSVRWSELYVDEADGLSRVREDVYTAVLQKL